MIARLPSLNFLWILLGFLITTNAFGQTALTTPYSANFSGSTLSEWTLLNGSSTNKWQHGSAVGNPANSLYISNDGGTSYAYTISGEATTVYAYIDIAFDADDRDFLLQFDWKSDGESNWDFMRVWLTPTTYVPTVGTLIAAGAGRVQMGGNFQKDTTWTTEQFFLSDTLAGKTKRIIFEWRNDGGGGLNPPAAIDNILINGYQCQSTVINPVSILDTSASFTLTPVADASGYYIEYGIEGFTPGSGTNFSTTVPSFTLGSLTANTSYTIYYKTICTADSSVVKVHHFKTSAGVVFAPFVDSFSNIGQWQLVNSATVNKWVLGSAAGNPAQSIYISNDGGEANAYSHTTTTVHAFLDIYFPDSAREIKLDFDWKSKGESNWDYIRSWMTPMSYIPVAGTQTTAALSGGIQFGGNLSESDAYTTESFDIPVDYAGTTKRLIFEWKNDGGGGSNPPGSIDNVNFKIGYCTIPDLSFNNLYDTSINIVIANIDEVSSVTMEYGTTGFTPGTGTTITITSSPYLITGLTGATGYTIRYNSNCATDTGSIRTFNFNTPNPLLYAPFLETFDTLTDSWTLSNGSALNKWNHGSATGNPAKSIYISNDEGVTNNYTNSSSAIVHAYADVYIPEDYTEINLSFDWRGKGESTFDYTRVWITPVSFTPTVGTQLTASNGTQIGGNYNLSATYVSQSHLLSSTYAGQTVRLVFEWRNDGSSGESPAGSIDNVAIDVSNCPAPTITTNTILDISADFEIAATSMAESYIIEYGVTGFTPGAGTVITTTDTLFDIEGLTPSTTYTLYYYAACETDSSITKSLSFTTANPLLYAPFLETFDTLTSSWILSNGTEVNKWNHGTATGNPAKSIYISNDAGVSNNYTNTTSAIVHAYADIYIPEDFSDIYLSFDWRGVGESTFDYTRVWVTPVGFTPTTGTQISTSSGGTQLGTIFNLSESFSNYGTFLSSTYSGQVIRVIFEWRNDGSSGVAPAAAIDNFKIEVSNCPAPTITTNMVLDVSGNFDIVTSSDAESYVIEYGPAGFTPGSGTVITTTDSIFTISGLNASTNYTLHYFAACTTDSSITKSLNFTTANPILYAPFFEPFDTLTNSWTLQNGTSANKWHHGIATGNPAKSIYISNDGGVTNGYIHTSTTVHAFADVLFPTGFSEYNLSFDWKGFGESTFDYTRVWLVPATFSPTVGTLITASSDRIQVGGNFNQSNDFVSFSTNLDTELVAGKLKRLVFEWRNDGSGGSIPGGAIDNLSVHVSNCPSSEIAIIEMLDSSGTFALSNAPLAEVYLIEYGPTGFTPGSGTTIASTDTVFTLTGLNPKTDYSIRYQNGCAMDSSMIKKFNFRTLNPLLIVSFNDPIDNMDYWSFSNSSVTNKWAHGSATGNPANSFYVSNDGGVTNNYTNSSASVAHVYADVYFPEDATDMSLKFDWKGVGESGFDYIRVWLAPTSFNPVANTQIATGGGNVQYGANYSNGTTFTTVTHALPNTLAGQTRRLLFEWRNDGSAGSSPAGAIDNIQINATIPCSEVTSILISEVTGNSALVSWESDTTRYNTYTITVINTEEETEVSYIANESPLLIEDLISDVDYIFAVSRYCDYRNQSDTLFSDTTRTLCIAPSLVVSNNETCISGTIELTASSEPNATIYWYNEDVLTSGIEDAEVLFEGNTFTTPEISTSTIYYVVAKIGNHNCYSEIKEVYAIVHPAPELLLPDSIVACIGNVITIDAGNADLYTFDWNTGATTHEIEVTENGVYTVMITDSNSCTNNAAVIAYFLPAPITEGFNFVPLIAENPKVVLFTPIESENVMNYHWNFGDGNESSDESPINTYASEGDYLVTLTVSNDCGVNEYSNTIGVDKINSIDDAEISNQLDIYPNPASNLVQIKNESSHNFTYIKVVDVSGSIVLNQQYKTTPAFLDISNLRSGTYHMILSNDKISVVKKLVVID